MQIRNKLLSELEHEASTLSSKKIGPVGFDYRRRTKIEKLLFLLAKEFCINIFGYDLGGLSYNHQKQLFNHLKNSDFKSNEISLIKQVFKIAELICDLSSSDPYAREEAMEDLGGSIYVIFDNLSKKILELIYNIKHLE